MGETKAIVTGANRGIGFQAASALARAGFAVTMACRDLGRSQAALEEIRAGAPGARVELLPLDLGSRASIAAFVEAYERKEGSVNVLINNAGISSTREKATADGFEPIVGTNFIGPFALTTGLLPLFPPAGRKRIVNLASSIIPYGRFSYEKLGSYRWFKAYAVSKYLMFLYTLALAASRPDIGCYSVDPGIVKTGIMFTGHWYDAIIDALIRSAYVTPEEGADTLVYLATADIVPDSPSRLFYRRKPKRVPARFLRDPRRERLIPYFNRLLGI